MTETSSHRYKPRNIINAPNVKSSIFSRSQQRGDSEIIQRWLSNHFYRWIIGDFPHVYPVRSVADYAVYFSADAEIPAWLAPKLGGDERFYYLNVQHPQLVAMERDLVEFLSRQEGTRLKLNYSASTALPCWQCAKRSIKKCSACVNKVGIPPTARR